MTQRLFHAPGPQADLLIKGARVVDPAQQLDDVRDVLVQQGRVVKVAARVAAPKGVRVLEGDGLWLLPGFVDLHTHFRVPGREDEEDLTSAGAAGAAGGYVALFGMANTDPVVDSAPMVKALAERAQLDAPIPCGFFAAVTKGLQGRELTEMADLADAGAVGFSDDGRSLPSALLVRRALQYCKITGRFVAIHAEDRSLMGSGVMHEGAVSAALGLTGIPAVAESLDVARAVELALYEQAPVHICHVSTPESVAHVARARAAGGLVTAEVTPHHLALTDEAVESLDTNLKMNPPLRSEADRRALVEALRDGVIDCIATDHAPHAAHEKDVPFEQAPFGTTGLETAFAAVNTACVATGDFDAATLVDRMSQAPARIAGIEVPTIAAGAFADLCLVDPTSDWTPAVSDLHSKSQNSAWIGRPLTGRVLATVAAGSLVWDVHGR